MVFSILGLSLGDEWVQRNILLSGGVNEPLRPFTTSINDLFGASASTLG